METIVGLVSCLLVFIALMIFFEFLEENGMFYKKRINRLENMVVKMKEDVEMQFSSTRDDRCEREILFRAAMKKMYELSGYEVKIVSQFAFFDAFTEEGWALIDKSNSGAVYYRKKKETKE